MALISAFILQPFAPLTAYADTATLGQIFTYSTPGTATWTVPDNVTSIKVKVWGSGGGGGNGAKVSNHNISGFGGGGGAYAEKTISVTPGAQYQVKVGLGGSGYVTGSIANGGENSEFTDNGTPLVGAGGGGGGVSGVGQTAGSGSDGQAGIGPGGGDAGSTTQGAGGHGGSAYAGDIFFDGVTGGPFTSVGGNPYASDGGSSPNGGNGGSRGRLGRDGQGCCVSSDTWAQDGGFPGGGGGGSDTGTGGYGANGQITIEVMAAGPIDQPPGGNFDGADCSASTGWSYDPDDQSAATAVHFYADGPAGSGTFIGAVTANIPRSDVNQTGIAGDHGFSFATPASLKDNAAHTIYAYGINANPGNQNSNNALLSGSPKTVTCAPDPNAPLSVTISINPNPANITVGQSVPATSVATGQGLTHHGMEVCQNGASCPDTSSQGGWVNVGGSSPVTDGTDNLSINVPFSSVGTYYLRAYVSNDNGQSYTYVPQSMWATINVSQSGGSNTAPNVPVVTGPVAGFINTSYSFSASATDPDGDNVRYGFDWDNNGSVDEYTGFVASGASASLSHSWATTGSQTFQVYAEDVSGAQSGPAGHTIIISQPNPTPGFTVSPTSGLVTTEAGGTASFTVVLDAAPASDVTISVASLDTTEGTVSASSLTFTAANWNAAQTVTVTGVDDAIVDGNVAYSVSVGPSSSSDASFNNLPAQTVSLVNNDNDVAPPGGTISSFSLNPTTITSGQSSTISWASANANLCVASGSWSGNVALSGSQSVGPFTVATSTPFTFTLDCGNSVSTSTQSVILTVNPAGGGGGPTGDFTVTAAPGLSTSETGSSAAFTVVMASAPLADVTMSVTSSDFTEGTTSTTLLTFQPANWNVPQTVTVTGIDDAVVDGNVAYVVTIGPSSSVDINFNNIAAKSVNLTNFDNDTAPGGGGGGGGGGSSGGSSGGSGGTSGGGSGGTYTGPCFGFNCPLAAASSGGSNIPGDVWILIDSTSGTGSGSGASGPTGPELVCPSVNFITTFLKAGGNNNPNEVRKLQYFLNTYEGANLAVNGEFDAATEAAVKAFQVKYSNEILAPWGVTEPTGVVYITTSLKINRVYCADHPDYAGNESIKDILDNNVLNNPTPDNSGQFQGLIGQATSTSSNIAGVFGGLSQRVLDALKGIPIYQLLILLLLLLGIGFTLQGTFQKDIESYGARVSFMRGIAVLTVASVLNVLNTLSFMLNPGWLADKTGLTLPWVLGLDMANVIAVVVICLAILIALYGRAAKIGQPEKGPAAK
ncbi:peptidoglycan-binding protein [Candidatus Parcubacteria bacterium]|nr:peptidoglycan-binding protein [Candidatus Parcubacteria bacterium]